jgi:hypothetical protein
MNLRKIPRFYHITHDLQIVWVIWDIYVDTRYVGQVAKNKIYGKTTAVVVGSGYWDTTWVGGGRTTCIRLRKGSDSTELC